MNTESTKIRLGEAARDIGSEQEDPGKLPIFLADPTIFRDRGIYYLYGTADKDSSQGIPVFVSTDLADWKGSCGKRGGYALRKGDVFGNGGFWAPQVFSFGGVYYMAYTADERVAIARSSSPLGPFRQECPGPLLADRFGKNIDPFVLFNDDGQAYLYYVEVDRENCIWVAKMNRRLSGIVDGTEQLCIRAELSWENTEHAAYPVAEGPCVMKYGRKYYLFYSANDFRSRDYSVGCAVGDTPFGPWEKSLAPLLSRQEIPAQGTGHGDLFIDRQGALCYVFHTHCSDHTPIPRRTAMIRLQERNIQSGTAALAVDAGSFRFLRRGG